MTIAAVKLGREPFFVHGRLCRKLTWLTDDHDPALHALLNDDCDTPDQLSLVEDLISRLQVLTSKDIHSISKAIANHIGMVWKLNPADSIIAAMNNGKDPDGSELALSFLKASLPATPSWKSRLYNNTDDALTDIKSGETLVLIEDFVGTGNKACTYIESLQAELARLAKANVDIKLVTFAGLEGSAAEFAKRIPDVQYWHARIEKRGISDHYPPEVVDKKLNEMLALEKKLRFKKRYQLGYEKSEALIALEGYSISNNVFPVFWCEQYANNAPRPSLFNRR